MMPQSDSIEALPVRERLLNAAEQVVAQDGAANLTLDAVAREAGCSKGGLLYHFPSKSALIVAILDRMGCQTDQKQDAHRAGDDRPGAFARAYLAARAEPLGPKDKPVHTAILAAAGTNPEFLTGLRGRFVEWQAMLEADGIDPATASIVRLAMDGMCLCNLLGLPVPEGELRLAVIDKLIAMTRAGDGNGGNGP